MSSRPGEVERAVLHDLKALEPRAPRATRSTLAQLALRVARELDGSPALTYVAKLATELRVLMAELREVARGRGDGSSDGDFSTPVRHGEESGAADVGAAGGGGGEAAG